MKSALDAWLARHAQTLLGSLGRLVRHPLATAMTIAVIAVALALPLFFAVLLQNTRTATANWNQAFELSVYLTQKADADRAAALAKQLRARPDVAAVRVITADQALAEFRSSSGFGKALDALRGQPAAEYPHRDAHARGEHLRIRLWRSRPASRPCPTWTRCSWTPNGCSA